MSLFLCPVCSAPLTRGERAYTCPGGHSYDIAREGYVHLLPANQMHSKAPGDDKNMAAARNRFLSGDFYAHLRHKLCGLAARLTPEAPAVLDAGCGEGYYTAGVYGALASAGKEPRMAGVDLSKPSLRWAAKREKSVEFAVASVYRLPVADHSVDLVINCFSPLALEEFRRVLKPRGVFLYVVPAAEHLWELKEVLYDKPYPNAEEESPYEGFEYLGIERAERTIHLEGGGTIRDLFGMTPYAWKTPKEGGARLDALTKLDVQAAFRIHMFRSLA